MTFVGHRRWPTTIAYLTVLASCLGALTWITFGPLTAVVVVPVVVLAELFDALRVEVRVEPSHLILARRPTPFARREIRIADIASVEVREQVPWSKRLLGRRYDRFHYAIHWGRCLLLVRHEGRPIVITVDDPEAVAAAIAKPDLLPREPATLVPLDPDPGWYEVP